MTATARARSPFVAIVAYAVQVCIPGRRRALLLLPCAGAVLFGMLSQLVTDDRAEAFAHAADAGLFSLVIPLGCLIIGDAVLGADVRAGTLHFTWLSPVPFPVIVAGRWVGGWLIAVATLTPAMVAAALVAGAPETIGALIVATIAGTAAYIGLFVMIGCLVRRAAVWSLAVVFLLERLLGTALSGIAQLSPMWEARAVYARLAPQAGDLLREGIPDGWGAVLRLALITAVTLAVAARRLGRLRLTGATD